MVQIEGTGAIHRVCPHCKTQGPKDRVPARRGMRWLFRQTPVHEAFCPNCLRVFNPFARRMLRRISEFVVFHQ